jgi:hypothetical protein
VQLNSQNIVFSVSSILFVTVEWQLAEVSGTSKAPPPTADVI